MTNGAVKPRVDLNAGGGLVQMISKCRKALWNAGMRRDSLKFKSEVVAAQSPDEVYQIAHDYCTLYVEGVQL